MLRSLSCCLALVAMLCSTVGCREEPAKIVMPENPSPLPDPKERLEFGGEATAIETSDKLSQ